MTIGGGRIGKRALRVQEIESDDGDTPMSMEKERQEREAKAKATTAEAELTDPLSNMVAAENRARIAKAKEGGGNRGAGEGMQTKEN